MGSIIHLNANAGGSSRSEPCLYALYVLAHSSCTGDVSSGVQVRSTLKGYCEVPGLWTQKSFFALDKMSEKNKCNMCTPSANGPFANRSGKMASREQELG